MNSVFRRTVILGTGLIGGSFGLALRKHSPDTKIVGWDREEVLRRAVERGAIHEAAGDIAQAMRGADLIYIALPVGTILELLPEIARHAEPRALVTDTGSTKATIRHHAASTFSSGAQFLGGHPLAGKEQSGIEQADAELFCGAKYALIGSEEDANERVRRFVELVRGIGAEPVWLDAETHDWAVAIVSHLPQMAAVALARVVGEETDETGLPLSLAGRGLRDMLRLAGSPYDVWRDIALTNADNIARSLDRLAQAIEHLRSRLTTKELADEFAAANEVYKSLNKIK